MTGVLTTPARLYVIVVTGTSERNHLYLSLQQTPEVLSGRTQHTPGAHRQTLYKRAFSPLAQPSSTYASDLPPLCRHEQRVVLQFRQHRAIRMLNKQTHRDGLASFAHVDAWLTPRRSCRA